MRYSIIHHDVREIFDLTISQYLVCDSIHQLSLRGVCDQGDTEISRFLGLNRSHVWDARKHLIKIGLVEIVQGGHSTTKKWHDAVTYKQSSKYQKVLENPTKVLENPTHTIYKDIKKKEVSKKTSLYEIVADLPQRKERVKKVAEALVLRQWCYDRVEEAYGNKPSVNEGDYFRIVAALKKMTTKDVKTMMEDAIASGKGRTVRGVFTDREIDLYCQNNL